MMFFVYLLKRNLNWPSPKIFIPSTKAFPLYFPMIIILGLPIVTSKFWSCSLFMSDLKVNGFLNIFTKKLRLEPESEIERYLR